MARPLPFFRWWNHDDAPLGLALQWIASNGDQLDPHELATSKMLNFDDRPERVDCWGPEGSGLAYALAPKTIDAWQEATEKLTQEIRQNALPVTGWKRSDSPRKQISPSVLKDIKIASPAEAEGKMLMSVFDDKNLVLEFGTYDNFPYCEGDKLRKGTEILWSRLTVPVESILNIWPRKSLIQDDVQATAGASLVITAVPVRHPEQAEIERQVRIKLASSAGRKSGENRRAARLWVGHAEELVQHARAKNPAWSQADVASDVIGGWKLRDVAVPSFEIVKKHIATMEREGRIPTSVRRAAKKHAQI